MVLRIQLPHCKLLAAMYCQFTFLFRLAELCLLCFLVRHSTVGCSAQEAPNLNVQQFTSGISYKQNICSRQQQVFNGSLLVPDALSGLQLNVGILTYSGSQERDFFHLTKEGTIDEENPGFFVTILDEVARRGNFTWRESFGILRPPNPAKDGNKTWNDLLDWSIGAYDLSANYWLAGETRMARGVYFPEGLLDSSIVVVSSSHKSKEDNVSIWAFLFPFETAVWILILVYIFVTGFMYWILEWLNPFSDERTVRNRQGDMIFYTAVTFTQHFLFRPQTHPARLLAFSWAFWSLIVGSAYTANLASFLVARQEPDNSFVLPFDKALKNSVPICVPGATFTDDHLSLRYPRANLIRKQSEALTLQGVASQECSMAAVPLSTWQQYETLSAYNPGCNFHVAQVIKIVPSGFATAVDTGGGNCTSLIGHMFNYHMWEMKDEGFVDKAWEDMLQRSGDDQNCRLNGANSNSNNDGSLSESFRFGPKDMAGIFIMHAILSGVALAIAGGGRIYRKCKARKDPAATSSSSDFFPNSHSSNNAATIVPSSRAAAQHISTSTAVIAPRKDFDSSNLYARRSPNGLPGLDHKSFSCRL